MPVLPEVFTRMPLSETRPKSPLSVPAMQVESALARGFLLMLPMRGAGLSAATSWMPQSLIVLPSITTFGFSTTIPLYRQSSILKLRRAM